jgi:hypothetical protein
MFRLTLPVVLRPDKFWFRGWAMCTFGMLPLLVFMAALQLLMIPLSLAAQFLQRLAAESDSRTA